MYNNIKPTFCARNCTMNDGIKKINRLKIYTGNNIIYNCT